MRYVSYGVRGLARRLVLENIRTQVGGRRWLCSPSSSLNTVPGIGFRVGFVSPDPRCLYTKYGLYSGTSLGLGRNVLVLSFL